MIDPAQFRGLLGVVAILGLAYLFSSQRSAVNRRLVLSGILFHFGFAVVLLKIPQTRWLFEQLAAGVVNLLSFAREGAAFVFGPLVTETSTFGFVFAFQVLPTIIFFSALTSLLFYYGILQRVIRCFGWMLRRVMPISGAEASAAAANSFIGQTEAPLVVKRFIPTMTRSELMALMTGGMATVAGSVLLAYVGLLGGADPEQQQIFARHLLTASLLNAPAALLLAKILVPETSAIRDEILPESVTVESGPLEAIANGTGQGLQLALMVGAVLIVFIALVALVNAVFGLVGSWFGWPLLSLQWVFGGIFAPVAWLVGVPTSDLAVFGALLGEKLVLNEFVAYVSLATLMEGEGGLDPRTVVLATYALCGFANFSSMGIQIGGIGVLAPERRPELCQLAPRALLAGTLATLLTAAVAGLFV